MWVLQIDDDEDDLEIFSMALRRFDPAIKYSGVLGMEAANLLFNTEGCLVPDVIFLDINMPRQSGFDCYAIFKGDTRFNNTKIIFLSTSINEKVMPAGSAFMKKQNSLIAYVKILQIQLPTRVRKSIDSDNYYQFKPYSSEYNSSEQIPESDGLLFHKKAS